ncbi:MAG: IS21 family transposase [Phycisphaerales bacterium]|nr:IS21 family transposase [Phycisphaerales bacterium]
MANRLKMATVHSILSLKGLGWSDRRIARELGVNRETVGRYVRWAEAQAAAGDGDPPGVDSPFASDNLLAGSAAGFKEPIEAFADSAAALEAQNQPNPPAGSARVLDRSAGAGSRPDLPVGSSGPPSRCEALREIILAGLDRGLSAQRIWQDLRSEHDFTGAYDSVKRFCRRLAHGRPLPFRRMEYAAGEEAQVDFGVGAPIVIPDGTALPVGVKTRRRKTHVLRVVLSHSRKGYSEVMLRQTTEDFLRALENAFRHFGGVPKTLVTDNLKAAVLKADWFDPELNPKLQAFAEHYGTVILPTKPRMPRHKGKVERGVARMRLEHVRRRVRRRRRRR